MAEMCIADPATRVLVVGLLVLQAVVEALAVVVGLHVPQSEGLAIFGRHPVPSEEGAEAKQAPSPDGAVQSCTCALPGAGE